MMRTIAIGMLLLAAPLAARAGEFALKDSDVVIFFGDALVENASYPVEVEAFVAAKYPELRTQFLNDGRGSETPESLLERYDADLAHRKIKPTVAVLCFGAYYTGLQPLADGEAAAFGQSLAKLVDRLTQDGVQVVLMTPPSAEEARNRTLGAIQFNEKVLTPLCNQIRELAHEKQIPLIDWYAKADEIRSKRNALSPTFAITTDGLNPTIEGQAVASALLLEHWNAEPIDVSINVDWKTGEITSDNGSVTASKTPDGGIEIVMNDIPMPWPGFSGRGAMMTDEWYASKFNSIRLTIKNVPNTGLMMGDSQRKYPVIPQLLEEGMNLATIEPLISAKPVAELWQFLNTKNRLWAKLIKEAHNKPEREELVKAHDSLVDTYRLYYEAYCQILANTPRTVSMTLTLEPLAALAPPEHGDERLKPADMSDPAQQVIGDEQKKLMKQE